MEQVVVRQNIKGFIQERAQEKTSTKTLWRSDFKQSRFMRFMAFPAHALSTTLHHPEY
jgi:hypothetical protein